MYAIPIVTDNSMVMATGMGSRGWMEVGKVEEENWDIRNSVKNKNTNPRSLLSKNFSLGN